MEPTAHGCHIEPFAHRLPHGIGSVECRCGHVACNAHTLTYYGTGDDPEAEGDYCMVCFGQTFGIWPDKTLRDGVAASIEF